MLFDTLQNFLASSSKKPKIVVVTGPTASGKTAAAVELALKFKGEVINADSRQMYKYLNIGTAKPTLEEMRGIPHHLFDFLEPEAESNVAIWRPLAEQKIAEILARGNLPIICGGTGLFINALTKNFTLPAIPPQLELRTELEKEVPSALWEKLQKIDPLAAAKLDPKNTRFVIRALEIAMVTGENKSALAQAKESPYESLLIALTLERTALYKKIALRSAQMKAQGFLKEVQNLMAQNISLASPAMLSHGYREAVSFLQGEISEEQFWEILQKNTRNYAKRQLTWWRRDARIQWFHGNSYEKIDIRNSMF